MSRWIVLLVVIVALPATAQTHRYMVFFNDKTGTPHSISTPSTFLSSRAVERRAKALVGIVAEDLPVVPDYVTQVRTTGAKAFFTTRWMNGVLVEANAAQRAAIESLPCVSSTEFVAPNQQLIGGRKGSKWAPMATEAATDGQLALLSLDSMHNDGFQGEGVMIAVFDSGFPGVDAVTAFQSLRDENRILLTTDFIRNSGDVFQYDQHGTQVLSIMAAEGTDFKGGAPKANYLLFVTEDVTDEYRVEEYNWLFAAERADSAGADIIQASVGYTEFDDPSMDYTTDELNGNTAVVSRAAGMARDRGIIVVVSAGNLGATPWHYISPPADATGILAVGAITASGARAGFSGVGPPIPLIKPDVVALGEGVQSINSSGSITPVSGTSAAAPLVSSLAAGLLQKYQIMDPATLVSNIRSTASNASSPDNETGFGIPSYLAVKNYVDRQFFPTVYPNPVANTLWITVGVTDNPLTLMILDSQGKIVLQASAPEVSWANSTGALDVSRLAAGLYVVHIVTGSGFATFRFVKL